MKTSELTGRALDYAVALAEGIPKRELKLPGYKGDGLFRYLRDEEGNLNGRYMTGPNLLFSQKWEAGGPIIERERIELRFEILDSSRKGVWVAQCLLTDAYGWRGETPLVAAMRCFVSSKLGDLVDIPEGLQ